MKLEISWGYPEIACVLAAKYALGGFILRRDDLKLPDDRVLREERLVDTLEYSWISIKSAQRLRSLLSQTKSPAAVSELQGRWQKIVCVMLWKWARDGVRLTEIDRSHIPHGKVLLAHGHAADIEYRFVERSEARRIANWERDNEGKIVMEAV